MNSLKFIYIKSLKVFLSIVLCLSLVPAYIFCFSDSHEAYASTKNVATSEEFQRALDGASDGDIIDLGGNSLVVGVDDGGDTPLVNNKNVTVQNGELTLWRAGILQGADLSLKDLKINFANPVRNGIFANEHKLTIENVTRDASSAYNIHIVMGRVINPTFTCPAKGYTPQLQIKGKNDLGKIIMGVFDDTPNGTGSTGGYYQLNPSVTIDSSCTQVSATIANRVVYACGASEPRGTGDGDTITPDTKYATNPTTLPGAVLNTYASRILQVYGDTGVNTKLTVNYDGDGNLTDSVSLYKISGLNVRSGVFKASSSTSFADVVGARSLGVSAGATLIAGELGDSAFCNFSGGGTLALGTTNSLKQTLTFTGNVTGETNVVFGDTNGFWKTGLADSVYVKAINSSSTAFASSNGPTGATWSRNDSGEWLWSTSSVTHTHTYGYVDIDEDEHAYECIDAGCPDEDRDAVYLEHRYVSDATRKCEDCGHMRIIINDIFTAKDSTKFEQFKAIVFNRLLRCEASIDVSSVGIKPEEITFSNSQGETYTGDVALRSIIRTHSLFSTFCITGMPAFTLRSDGTIKSVEVEYYTLWTQSQVSQFEESYEKAMATVRVNYSDFQKAVALHDWLCDNVDYGNQTGGYDGVALGAFLNGKAICDGYAAAYKFLCEQAGLECYEVGGKTTKELHAWNKVKVNGYWFWVDTTWDGSSSTTTHNFMLYNDVEWKTAGNGEHGGDCDVTYAPENTKAYFKNKFWEGVTGVLTAEQLEQDPQLTLYGGCDINGHTWDAGVVTKRPSRTVFGEKTFTCIVCGEKRTEQIAKLQATAMHRLYNPNSGEHFYTSNNDEKSHLVSLGWVYENVGWYAPTSSKVPVYRLYNPNGGDHHYTASKDEYDWLKTVGWTQEGIGWYSDEEQGVALHRQYNPNAKSGSHNFTASKDENNWLVSLGWRAEGIGWYGLE